MWHCTCGYGLWWAGDIVYPGVGYKVSLTDENDVAAQMEKVLTEPAHNRDHLERLRRQDAQKRLTWAAKAQDTTKVLHWALRRGPGPDFLPPKMLHLERASSS
jgi:hypothetical protein